MNNRLVECVPNYSEGRDLNKIEKILQCFRAKEGVKLLDYSSDKDHNRTVVTLAGSPEEVAAAVIESVGVAKELIDLRVHEGQHPRMGAVDVIPFVPLKNFTMQEAIELSKAVAEKIAEKYGIPVYLYEKSASIPEHENLANVRSGQFEGLSEKMKNPLWKPDFGSSMPHPSAGAIACGARAFLCAFNVNLNTSDLAVAVAIAKKVRHIGGGLHYCKAMGVKLEERNIVQVSMNLTDYTKTSLYAAFELVKTEAKRYGVTAVGSEVIGLMPMKALIDAAEYYLQIEKFSIDQVIESKIYE